MKRSTILTSAATATLGLAIAIGSIAIAQEAKESKPAAQPEIQLPPGWTQADMQACILAGTPGKMQEHLVKGAGTWHGKITMWMMPGADPVQSECTSTVTPIMDGRYVRVEMAGEMPGMGPYSGFGLHGFDNVSQKFVSTWVDNHSTGIMQGAGELSPDGKTLTWRYTYSCPITQKPAVLREIETITGPNTRTLEMIGTEPKSRKEYKMMRIEFTKK